MASNINYTDIDATYPVAGQDNDSQGFRDNFSTIRNSLQEAQSEITTLQSDTAKLNATNDFNGNIIQEADFKAVTEFVNPSVNITASQNISFLAGHYQIIQVGNSITLTFDDWPDSGKMGKIRLQLTSDGSARTVTWATTAGSIKDDGNALWSSFILTSDEDPVIADFWTVNGGTTVFAQIVGSFS
jgi:hypothetical protein